MYSREGSQRRRPNVWAMPLAQAMLIQPMATLTQLASTPKLDDAMTHTAQLWHPEGKAMGHVKAYRCRDLPVEVLTIGYSIMEVTDRENSTYAVSLLLQ